MEYYKGENKNGILDAVVSTRYHIAGTNYCKKIRENEEVPAFGSIVCGNCLAKGCEFFNICVELDVITNRNIGR